ncbi:MAG: helix-turn-helix domain-containing protein [Methylococcaceae bacterium]
MNQQTQRKADLMDDVSYIESDQQGASLANCARQAVEAYLTQLNSLNVTDVYELVMCEVEKPLLEVVLQHVEQNQTKAAQVLGISRGTLRKKLIQHKLI